MKQEKERIDVLLVKQGLIESREKAKSLIMAGQVYLEEQKVDKPGTLMPPDAKLIVRSLPKYVSRGGLKLEKALLRFNISLKDLVSMDIGASTGGFTDCMLQQGAKKVYAVDVGYGQLAWKLRTHPQVCNLERTNIRYLDRALIDPLPHFVSVDVSFISLKLVLPKIKELLIPTGQGVALIKPQFEAGRDQVGKKGVVRDQRVHEEVLKNVTAFTQETGFSVLGLSYSPITGPEGNIEYLMHFCPHSKETSWKEDEISQLVEEAHQDLRSERKGGV